MARRFLSQPKDVVERDINETHQTVLRGRLKAADVADWWIDPSSCDIQGIDTKQAAILDMRRGKTTKQGIIGRNVAVMADTQKERDAIRKYIHDGFTTEEINAASRKNTILVSIRKPQRGIGSYDPSTGIIMISPEASRNPSTTVHEFSHHLRFVSGRKGITKSYIPKTQAPTLYEREIEEAINTAETTTRMTPYSIGTISYYGTIGGISDLDADRKRFTGNNKVGSRGLIGKSAISAVEKEFNNSKIAGMKRHSNMEAREILKGMNK